MEVLGQGSYIGSSLRNHGEDHVSCDAKKQCFLFQATQTKEYFSHVAWQTRDPKRRLCLQCQTKTRGSWKCAVCHQRRSHHHFSYFISRRPSGKDGTQTCDTCHAAKVQHARCCFQDSPPRASPEKASPQAHYPGDMGSNRRKQESMHT